MSTHTRHRRVPAALTDPEFSHLQRLASELGIPMSRILLELAKPGLKQIVQGKNPIPNAAKIKRQYQSEICQRGVRS